MSAGCTGLASCYYSVAMYINILCYQLSLHFYKNRQYCHIKADRNAISRLIRLNSSCLGTREMVLLSDTTQLHVGNLGFRKIRISNWSGLWGKIRKQRKKKLSWMDIAIGRAMSRWTPSNLRHWPFDHPTTAEHYFSPQSCSACGQHYCRRLPHIPHN